MSNLVKMEVAIDASNLVSLEAEAKKGGLSAEQCLSSFLPGWIASILAQRKDGARTNRRMA